MQEFKIYFTSDVHGKVLPVDYQTGKPRRRGLMDIAAELEKDSNTIVCDGGDALQGSALMQYYLEHQERFPLHPVAFGFRAMGLEVFTLGNHDFNFGYDVLRDYLREVNAVCVCANVEDRRGELGLKKTWIKTLENGLRIGFTGVVTDYVNLWEKTEHLAELKVSDPIPAAEAALKELTGKCDVTVCIYHGGYERDLVSGRKLTESRENVACELAEKLDFDILLTGHQHMAVPGVMLNGTFSVQPPNDADRYIEIKAALKNDGLHCEGTLKTISADCSEADYAALLPLEQQTENWLDQEIGKLSEAIPAESKLALGVHGSALAALFNEIMLKNYPADFACCSLGNDPIGLPSSVSIRSVYAAYQFANTLTVKKVTKAVLKACLERCASYLELNENGEIYIGDTFLQPKIEHYNYDFFAGLDYAFDLRKPHGERVAWIRSLDGTELRDDESYTLVTSDYRATGTGGYEALGECETVFSGADNMQDLIVEYIRQQPELHVPDNYRFRLLV